MTEFKPQITFEDFAKVDLRVATITHAEHHPNADKQKSTRLNSSH